MSGADCPIYEYYSRPYTRFLSIYLYFFRTQFLDFFKTRMSRAAVRFIP